MAHPFHRHHITQRENRRMIELEGPHIPFSLALIKRPLMVINESRETLNALLSEYAGTPRERRLEFLLALKDNPHRAWIDIARTLGIPKRTVDNWLRVYRRKGITALMALRAQSPRKETQEPASALEPDNLAHEVKEAFRKLLNRLPQDLETVVWAKELRKVLMEHLGDVDYVVITVRTTLDLVQPETNKQGQVYIKRHDTATARTKVKIAAASDPWRWEAVFERGKREGFPAHLYQDPVGFDFWYKTADSRLGSILLFRLLEKPPISERTKAWMEEFRPFLEYVLSDHIARQRLLNPADLVFRDLVPRIAADADLTKREQQVLMLMMASYTHADMAEQLHISIKTLETHITHIFSKTGVSRASDLWLRYMTPQLLPSVP